MKQLLIVVILFFATAAFSQDLNFPTNTNLDSWKVELFSSPGRTSSSYMPQLLGVNFLYSLENFEILVGLSEPTYSTETILDSALASTQKNSRTDSKMFHTGLRKKLPYFLFVDLSLGVNMFKYEYSGLDLSCCSQASFSRNYTFTGVFLNPALGLIFEFHQFAFGLQFFSWLEYISKSNTQGPQAKAPSSSDIMTRLNNYDTDTVQSSGLLPPTLFFSYRY